MKRAACSPACRNAERKYALVGPPTFNLCEVEGIKTYLKSSSDIMNSAVGIFSPAWLVRPTLGNMDGEKLETPTMVLQTKLLDIDLKYAKAFLSAPQTLNLQVRLYSLVCEAGYVGQENVELTRPTLATQIQAVPAVLKKFKSREAARKANLKEQSPNKGQTNKSVNNGEWASISKHLLI